MDTYLTKITVSQTAVHRPMNSLEKSLDARQIVDQINLLLTQYCIGIDRDVKKAVQYHWLTQRTRISPAKELAPIEVTVPDDTSIDNEIVYYAVRKHTISLLQKGLLSFPIVFLILWLLHFFWSVKISFLAIMFALLLIHTRNWFNTYYVVTNQRILWKERITYKWREVLISDVLSVRAVTDNLGRIFQYGIVELETKTGNLELDLVQSHHELARLVQSFVEQSETLNHEINMDISADKLQFIRDDLFELKDVPDTKDKKKNLFNMRFESDGAIICRKHLINLFRTAFMPIILTVALVVWLLRQVYLSSTQDERALPSFVTIILFYGIMMTFIWMLYYYVDWKNDIYKITKDNIFAISRKPFGVEVSRSITFQNIKSIKYERVGLVAALFNFGTVFIDMGSDIFEFKDVLDPVAIVQEINVRIEAYAKSS